MISMSPHTLLTPPITISSTHICRPLATSPFQRVSRAFRHLAPDDGLYVLEGGFEGGGKGARGAVFAVVPAQFESL